MPPTKCRGCFASRKAPPDQRTEGLETPSSRRIAEIPQNKGVSSLTPCCSEWSANRQPGLPWSRGRPGRGGGVGTSPEPRQPSVAGTIRTPGSPAPGLGRAGGGAREGDAPSPAAGRGRGEARSRPGCFRPPHQRARGYRAGGGSGRETGNAQGPRLAPQARAAAPAFPAAVRHSVPDPRGRRLLPPGAVAACAVSAAPPLSPSLRQLRQAAHQEARVRMGSLR
ncbi:hypothetical protein H8959_018879 [Pygathrix nigripes]